VLSPLPDSPAADVEHASQIGILLDAERPLHLGFGHGVHMAQESRTLDTAKSSTLGGLSSSLLDMTMGKRLKLALESRNLRPAELISRTGLSKATIYFLLDDTTSPDKVRDSTIKKLCRVLRVSSEWLTHGRGDMDEPAAAQDAEQWEDVVGYAQAVGLGAGAEAEEYAESHKLKFKASSLRRKNLRPEKLAVFYGRGDSMLPRIRSGDAILFDIGDTRPRDDTLYVIQVHGLANKEYQVKRAMVLEDGVYFQADNPAGDHDWRRPLRMDSKRAKIEIIGRVRWIGSWED
jgi:phage repressor protein C with HTH and peptisase S24 domain